MLTPSCFSQTERLTSLRNVETENRRTAALNYSHLTLMCMGTRFCSYSNFTKVKNFCEFLYVSPGDEIHPKGVNF